MERLTLDATVSKPLSFDLRQTSLRQVNQFLHRELTAGQTVQIAHPDGAHSLAVGLTVPAEVNVEGHVGYYAAGMNQQARVTIRGNAGPGVAENMMSGRVHVTGFASVSAGASAHGGRLIIDGAAGLRCGISLKGADIVVGGSVGSFSAFMAQAGRLVICGDAGDALGDSLYEAVIYIRGEAKSLGADAQFEEMRDRDYEALHELLSEADLTHDPRSFRRIASAKQLYHWNANAQQDY